MEEFRIILIHGWHVRDGGERTLGPLKRSLEKLGHEVIMPSYGHVFFRRKTQMVSRKFAKQLSANIEPGDVVVGHSNGCRIAWELSFYAPLVRAMIWLSPALDSDVVPAKSVRDCLVVHSKRDRAVRLARLLPGSIWGDMGRVGYRPEESSPWGADSRMTNFKHDGRHSDYHLGTDDWAKMVSEFPTS